MILFFVASLLFLALLACRGLTGTSVTDYLADKLLNHTFRNTAYTPAATVYGALYTAIPSDTAGSGTEATYTSYARAAITFGAPAANTGGGRVIANTAVVNFPTSTGGTNIIVGGQVMDALTVGNGLSWSYSDQQVTINNGSNKDVDVGEWLVALD